MPRILLDAPEVVPSPSRFPRGCGCVVAAMFLFAFLFYGPDFCSRTGTLHGRGHREHKEKGPCMSIVIGLKGYEIEYEKDLLELLGKPLQTDAPVDSDILGALTATDKRWNARGIRFLDPPRANKEGKQGISEDGEGKPRLRDWWGNPYFIRCDDDKDGKIAHPQKPGEFIEARYIVYTAGRDMNPVTWEDNVTSIPRLPRKPFWFWE